MELRHLKYFVTVAEEKNFSRASARLRVSQPAVSRQIKDLEGELGVSLLIRDGRGVRLTAAGETFLAHARDLLKRAASAAEEMKGFQRNAADKLAIGYIAPVMAGILTPALRRFEHALPRVELELVEMSPQHQVKALNAGKIDIAFPGSSCPEVDAQFAVQALARIPLQAVLSDNHPLGLRKQLKLNELAGDAFIGFSEATFPGRNAAICRACQSAGFTPRIRYRAEGISAMLALVATGKGVTLAPEEVSQLPHPQTVFVKLKPPAPFVVSVAAHRKNDERVAVTRLLEFCRESRRRERAM